MSADTLFALSSGRGRAGVAVVRISGSGAGRGLTALAGALPSPRRAVLRSLTDPVSGDVLDRGLVLWFPGPDSFTGEDVAELHLHGGRAVVAGVLEALGRMDGFALAEPGAFTRRAFEAGKLDLTEVEALADLIDAETEAQRRQAIGQMSGGLGAEAAQWRSEVLAAQALVEAAIDFSDEADVSDRAVADASVIAKRLAARIRRILADGRRGEILREGFHVAIVGAPNAGKSSLLNALSRRDAAIVSDEPGTTRDIIDVHLDLDGFAVVLSDTAGLRDGGGTIEREGMRRAIAKAQAADLVLMLHDGVPAAGDFSPELPMNLDASKPVLHVVNKCDLRARGWLPPSGCIGISALTGDGLDRLTREIAARAGAAIGGAESGEAAVITRARQRLQLVSALEALVQFIDARGAAIELRAEDLRQAADALGKLLGRIDVEDVLGEIFGRFCIGK